MDNATDQKVEGRMDQAKGRVKQAWGDLTGDDSTHAEGTADEMAGNVKEKVGQARESIADAIRGRK